MMRQADSAVRMLLRLQEARRKLEARPEDHDRAERAEHITAVLMKQAFDTPAPARRPPPPAEPAQVMRGARSATRQSRPNRRTRPASHPTILRPENTQLRRPRDTRPHPPPNSQNPPGTRSKTPASAPSSTRTASVPANPTPTAATRAKMPPCFSWLGARRNAAPIQTRPKQHRNRTDRARAKGSPDDPAGTERTIKPAQFPPRPGSG